MTQSEGEWPAVTASRSKRWEPDVAPNHRTRTALLASRKQPPPLSATEIAGGAPANAPENRIDRNTREFKPLTAERIHATSRNALLQSRRSSAGAREQKAYDSWDEANPIWEVPNFGLAEDWVSNPKHKTYTQLKAAELRSKRALANMRPGRHDPKFDDCAQPASTAYVQDPKSKTVTELREQRGAEEKATVQRNTIALGFKKNARQRLLEREDQLVLQQQAVPAGKSRNHMKLQRRHQSTKYEKEAHAQRAKQAARCQERWASHTHGESFWKCDKGWVAQPKECSSARLFTTQRGHLKQERYNVYSDPQPDDFKAVYQALKPARSDEDLVINPTRVGRFKKSALVQQIKGMRSRDTTFTDYQLHFRKEIVVTAESSVGDMDPLYSSFTKDKTFDPNTGLPSRLRTPRYSPRDSSDDGGSSQSEEEDVGFAESDEDNWVEEHEVPGGCSWTPALIQDDSGSDEEATDATQQMIRDTYTIEPEKTAHDTFTAVSYTHLTLPTKRIV
eukprot:TRINITY_DN6836_c0_g1_i3.p1 TRINITY_DN6836_c0_g1~~TRINITY_DN6836_c0_g1_i3.p1  ORF type:complete len:505 (+),score=84.82 TRINITY_DN6836_c0_g1_i3:46-1560(+)